MLTAVIGSCLGLLPYSLSDLSWTLKNQNGSTVESQAHIDHFKAGVINDPLPWVLTARSDVIQDGT